MTITDRLVKKQASITRKVRRMIKVTNWETALGMWRIEMRLEPTPFFVAEHEEIDKSKKPPHWMRQSAHSLNELLGEIDRVVKAH